MSGQLDWFKGGIVLGAVFFLIILFVKPIGVSTQFVILDGIIWNIFSDELVVEDSKTKSGYSSSNAYLNKSGGKYAKSIANPFNYGFLFMLFMAAGAFLSAKIKGLNPSQTDKKAPEVWRNRFGEDTLKRYIAAFIGGLLVILGARLAGGCTSGHMMSGMMQTSVSGYLFAFGAFAAAIPFAIFLYRGKERSEQ